MDLTTALQIVSIAFGRMGVLTGIFTGIIACFKQQDLLFLALPQICVERVSQTIMERHQRPSTGQTTIGVIIALTNTRGHTQTTSTQ
jgi:hypothetical protein